MEPIDEAAHKTLVADVAVMMNEMKNMSASIARIEQNLREDRSTYVTRAEWEARETGQDRELKELKERDKSRGAAWASGVAVVVAVIGALITLVQAIN